jgi:hypothetical protein
MCNEATTNPAASVLEATTIRMDQRAEKFVRPAVDEFPLPFHEDNLPAMLSSIAVLGKHARPRFPVRRDLYTVLRAQLLEHRTRADLGYRLRS